MNSSSRSYSCCPSSRRGISVSTILVSLLIVVLAVLSAASTVVALKATKARQKAEEDFARSQATLDALVKEIANHPELKGFKMLKVRDSLVKQALAYYESYVKAHAADEVPPLNAPAAQFRVAGLYAKLGSKNSVPALASALIMINKLREAKVDPDTYPSMQECAMGIAEPREWMMLKGASMKEMQDHVPKLVFGLAGAMTQYLHVNREFPQAVRPRDELAYVYFYLGALQAQAGRRKEGLSQLNQARQFLDGLVREQPGNLEFQRRLGEVCMIMGDTEKRQKDNAAALASYEKAVQMCEALVAANPEDKQLAEQLAAAKKALDSIKTAADSIKTAAPAADGETPAEEEAAAASEPSGADAQPAADGPAAEVATP